MNRLLVAALLVSALCGCSSLPFLGGGQAPPAVEAKASQPQTGPVAPAPAEAATPAEPSLAAYERPVSWDMNRLMPVCPRCGAEVKLRGTVCGRCYARFRWHDLPVEDSPSGAFERLKLAEVYSDAQTFRECVCQSDLDMVMDTLGHAVESGRDALLEPQVIDERVEGERARLTVTQRGRRASLDLVREGGAWKFSLRSLREEVFADKARVRVTAIAAAIERYAADRGKLPSADFWIRELSGKDARGRPFYTFDGLLRASPLDARRRETSDRSLADPWWGEYVYRPDVSDGRRPFLFYSKGPNGRDDGGQGDDILPQ